MDKTNTGFAVVDADQSQETSVQILDALLYCQQKSNSGWCTASEVSEVMRERLGCAKHHNTIRSVLKNSGASVARRKRNGSWQFRRVDVARTSESNGLGVWLFQPDSVTHNILQLHQLLSTLIGKVRICDPYVDNTTLEHIERIPNDASIRLLGSNVRYDGPFRRVVAAMRKDGRSFEVRRLVGRELHDRYIVDDRRLVIVGTSLNQFGSKQTFVTDAGDSLRATVAESFDDAWRRASSVASTL